MFFCNKRCPFTGTSLYLNSVIQFRWIWERPAGVKMCAFDGGRLTTDAGAVLLSATDKP